MKWPQQTPRPKSLTLFGYWRSSASWRVRWALALKKQTFSLSAINLLKGEHKSDHFKKINPAQRVPALSVNNQEWILCESMAILLWIEEVFNLEGPSLFPGNPLERAKIIELCEIINSGTAPLQVPACQKAHSDDPIERLAWTQKWVRLGLTNFQESSQRLSRSYSGYDELSASDLFLIPQIYNAKRYEIDVKKEFPYLENIYNKCLSNPIAQAAHPDQQEDKPK